MAAMIDLRRRSGEVVSRSTASWGTHQWIGPQLLQPGGDPRSADGIGLGEMAAGQGGGDGATSAVLVRISPGEFAFSEQVEPAVRRQPCANRIPYSTTRMPS